MRIGITGSSGLIGTALTERLGRDGHTAVPIVRHEPGEDEIGWHPSEGRLDPDDLAPLDAVVHLAGAGIGGRRWNDEYRQTILESRTTSTRLLADAVARADGPKVLVSGSAVGFYGSRGDEVLTESSTRGDGFLTDVCVAWEAATKVAEEAGIRVAHIRTGIVLSSDGGALPKMLPLFKVGLGGRFGNGRQWMSWISIDDQVAAITHLLTSELSGPVNLTAPNPVTNAEFTDVLGDVLHRPTIVPVPAFGPRLLLGHDMADALLLEGQRVEPVALSGDGFEFAHVELGAALRAVLDR